MKKVPYWMLFIGGLLLQDGSAIGAIGVICIIIGVSRLSEINGFRRGRLAAFTGEKE
ncbi:hypothetical protein PWKp15_00045 [Klebsiella phage PWKp15]|uniref:Uncharacterized protein n=1 Tax=Klebsiella phage vB_Kp_IME328 TaxID=2880890 RepID=A0AAE9C5M5_9CAUD|nr:hypothetical protein [Klebsiella phage vB_Kp_IME328]UJD05322.1 hypothetical protein PWKp15_00045 [Klebsiella phage PWKp15]